MHEREFIENPSPTWNGPSQKYPHHLLSLCWLMCLWSHSKAKPDRFLSRAHQDYPFFESTILVLTFQPTKLNEHSLLCIVANTNQFVIVSRPFYIGIGMSLHYYIIIEKKTRTLVQTTRSRPSISNVLLNGQQLVFPLSENQRTRMNEWLNE